MSLDVSAASAVTFMETLVPSVFGSQDSILGAEGGLYVHAVAVAAAEEPTLLIALNSKLFDSPRLEVGIEMVQLPVSGQVPSPAPLQENDSTAGYDSPCTPTWNVTESGVASFQVTWGVGGKPCRFNRI